MNDDEQIGSATLSATGATAPVAPVVSAATAAQAPAAATAGADAPIMSVAAAIETLFDYLKNVIYYPQRAQLDPESLPADFVTFAQGLLYFGNSVAEMRALADDIARGRLEGSPTSPGNELASDLKSLQATLKHLAWQINQVAKGDYKQRVSFLGELSEAVNNMIVQLGERTASLEQTAETLRENNDMLIALAEHIDQWIIVLDRASGETLYSNRETGETLNDPVEEDRLRAWLIERALNYNASSDERLIKEISFDEAGPWDVPGPNRQFLQITLNPFTWQEHKALTFLITDITEEKRRREELESVAFFDALTGAYSRHYGMNLLEKWLAQGECFAICFVDMDNLKYINDSFGHEAGDEYILSVSNKLQSGARATAMGGTGLGSETEASASGSATEVPASGDARTDETATDAEVAGPVCVISEIVLSRLGGDEFMLLCPGWSKQEAECWLEDVRSQLVAESGDECQRSISYGVVQADGKAGHSGSELLAQADELMYEYKRSRKMERRATLP
ncbi:MAG: GGDEF domain-containing protein [Coriobacteriales bacterium]|jgi:GGDEF domain-containing protein/PAS domain-containing protein|nr:GGDEF domain-containing protein [Coriobacteriales bacterium]